MSGIIEGYNYDIFISYRQNDNRYDGWVTEFAANLKKELDATIKNKISVYFDANPQDGLLETHSVDRSLADKLKCLIFIPVLSRTYCDSKSFAWNFEFLPFLEIAKHDPLGLNIKLIGSNVASRVLPVRIHDLNPEDVKLVEANIGIIRSVDFIYKSTGVNRPLRANEDHPQDNLNRTYYRDQINKVANAIDEILESIKELQSTAEEATFITENPKSGHDPEYATYEDIEQPVIMHNTLSFPVKYGKKGKEEKHKSGAYRLANFKKLVYTLLVIAPLVAFIFSWDSLARIMGSGNSKRESAKTHVENAVKLIDDQNYEAARVELELALEDDPKYSVAWSSMAAVSVKEGNLNKAILETTEAIKLDPGNGQAAYNLAFGLEEKQDYGQALEWYGKAIAIDSTQVYAYSALGRLYNKMNRSVDALLVLSQAKNKFPESDYIYLIYKNLGNAYLLESMIDSALKYLELSRVINPAEPETNLFLARAYESSGKTVRSIELWQAYIELETDTVKINDARKHLKEITVNHLREIIK